ncbi:DinB family protein [Lutibacter flavus]|uniref:DinB superfamily protein n=1 Tax=Lutibacter flavus TaxID=691689 RepID=A0A238VCW0_9FLAO|nr:DinB family protein [Lutibacter flavus]SNR32225.1 DinB superfamily protein [Lutibacter flavus]
MKTLINNIVKQLKDIQNEQVWLNVNFKKKLDLLNENEIFTRPIPTLHSVAELISHLTFWRQEAILKIKTKKGLLTDESEENWLTIEQLKIIGWNKIKSDYDDSLTEIIQLLEQKDDSFLNELYFDTDYKNYYNYSFLIEGILHHDIYHLGQIGMLVKLIKAK